MERKELKDIFNRIERNTSDAQELLDFLNNICESDIVEENCRYLNILVKLIKERFDKVELANTELRIACLD